ncbi:MAG: SelT/SelW/SelH family protein [Gammaproteobacteria bacterium]|nr:SelT/SelW/SelH family protein [Gammaproteobacteria bacterium]NIN61542.1 SelT/SelW/SelH family protein [Gammaproteobacteria bacterium]NIO62736.1 SelT/SelW/SelH family protein [Gammaproteobacteria bacterium]NIQ19300.1 SelT/SelW/SelH family protein [Gammaproteobacteria bacterium]NIT05371.1 SelT/SelW/SelH family protein [Gammaproteobacteria bacterium]
MSRKVEIEYCAQCRFILRASWMAQEILMTFPEEISALCLIPGEGGVFNVRLDDKELKQLLRDRIAPGKDLGHSDY